MFFCSDWDPLIDDLRELDQEKVVAVFLVTEPFGNHNQRSLKECFPDKMIEFKDHFVADLDEPINDIISKHHRKKARRSLKDVEIEITSEPMDHLEDWIGLYDNLIRKRGIQDFRMFSHDSFKSQFSINGLDVIRASIDDETVGMQLWMNHGEHAYAHLSAYSDLGYERSASYAIRYFAIEHYKEMGLMKLDLGGTSGLSDSFDKGLMKFKEGWSNQREPVYFCGRILNKDQYELICKNRSIENTDYFPAYRKGEFN